MRTSSTPLTSTRLTGVIACALALIGVWTSPSNSRAEFVSHTTRAVEEAIRAVPDLKPHRIDIETHQGFVRLTGYVGSADDRAAIERAVQALPEINSVKNELTVSSVHAPTNVGPSARLAESIKSEIAADHSLGRYTLDVLVSGEATSLIGTVARDEDRAAIERITRRTPGVKTIYNQLTVAAPRSDIVVENDVRRALERAGDVDLAGLDISASDGTVTFVGRRNNHREIDRILSVALMVDGVQKIKSDMTIAPRR